MEHSSIVRGRGPRKIIGQIIKRDLEFNSLFVDQILVIGLDNVDDLCI